jgi:hypothetical protein
MTPFDFINDISNGKEYLLKTELDKKDYNSWMVNKGFSYFIDTILYSAEINLYPDLDKDMHHDYLFYSIKKKKRFSKWAKNNKDKDILKLAAHFGVSYEKAKFFSSVIPQEEKDKILKIDK